MLIAELIKSLFSKRDATGSTVDSPIPTRNAGSTVLNVGGSSKSIAIPAHYRDWQHLLLDIDPRGDADIILDARKLHTLAAGQFDAVYCSHNLEHYYRHDVQSVLAGFYHVLKPDGFAEVHVPDMRAVLKRFVETGMEMGDILYESPGGPISVADVIYGWGKQIESSGGDFYAHKNGFTKASLTAALTTAGFTHVWIADSANPFSLGALAFKQNPTAAHMSLFTLQQP